MPLFITDRTSINVARRNELSAKGWSGMTAEEKKLWRGDPFETDGANLLPYSSNYSSTVDLKYKNDSIILTATVEGIYLFTPLIVGEAVNFENKVFTLSVSNMVSTGGATPRISAWWHDNDGSSTYAGAVLDAAGTAQIDTTLYPNTSKKQYLALYIYATTEASVAVGATARFEKVMLSLGDTAHDYTQYVEIVPNECTKGAFNYSDLNRIERIVSEMSDAASFNLVTKTDWRMWDVPTESEMTRFILNISTIRNRYASNIPLVSTMKNLLYSDANNIEKILQEAYQKAIGQGGTT